MMLNPFKYLKTVILSQKAFGLPHIMHPAGWLNPFIALDLRAFLFTWGYFMLYYLT